MKSLIYIGSVICFLITFMYVKKADKQLNAFIWFGVALISMLCAQAFMAGIFGIVHIPLSMISMMIVNFLCSVIFGYIGRQSGSQEYYFNKRDIVSVASLLIISVVFFLVYFTPNFLIRFGGTDPAEHMYYAGTIYRHHTLPANLYFAALQDGIWMEVFDPIWNGIDLYKSFIIGEVFWFFISGYLFWMILRMRYDADKEWLIGVVVTGLYWVGYPLYTILFGFTYFGASVSIVSFIIVLWQLYKKDEMSRSWLVCLLNISLYSLMVCYTLLVPVVYLACGLTSFFIEKKTKHVWNVSNILEQLMIYTVPVVLGLYYSISNMSYVSGNVGLVTDGGCYNEAFYSFWIFMPFVISGLILIWKDKRSFSFELVLFAVLIAFMFGMFMLGMQGKVSVYYYVKNNNVLWLLCFIFLFEAVKYLFEHFRAFLIGGLCTLVVMLGFAGLVEPKVKERNERYILTSTSSALGIYMFNYAFLRNTSISPETLELINNCIEIEKNSGDDITILGVGGEFDMRWFHALADQDDTISYGTQDELYKFLENDAQYLLVIRTGIGAQYDIPVKGEVIAENSVGYILQIN